MICHDKAKRAQQGDLIRFQVPNNATSVVLNKQTETIFVTKRAEEESGKKLVVDFTPLDVRSKAAKLTREVPKYKIHSLLVFIGVRGVAAQCAIYHF